MQGFCCHFVSGRLFYHTAENTDFICPCLDILCPFHLRKIHNMNRNVLRKNLPCFLLAVTGGLPYIHICNPEKRTGPVQSCADRCLNQRTGIGWKHFLSTRNPELGPAAQAGRNGIRCKYDFIRNIYAERSEYLSAFFLMLDQFRRSHTMDFRHNEIVIIHALRSVFLRKIHISKGLRKYLTELVVCLYIHSKIFPHLMIICHFIFLLCRETKARLLVSRTPVFRTSYLLLRVTCFRQGFNLAWQIVLSFFHIFVFFYR